ncbi:MAG: RNA polymerase sigma factor [Gemmatimonadales bacterium]
MGPPELTRLLETTDSKNREAAWDAFIEKFHRLLMHVAHSIDDQYDATMDRYAYMLERLQAGNYRRLRRYGPQTRAQFSTWLVVVARRLCVDFHRETHGRQRPTKGEDRSEIRMRLVDLVGESIDPDYLADGKAIDPAEHTLAIDRRGILENAMKALTNQDRLLLTLRFELDASVSEIADALKFPSQFHVYRRLKKILAVLRTSLNARGIQDV